jgi:Ni,Fe-hydrogenase III small subunit
MPRTAFSKSIAPFIGTERRLKSAVLIFSPHKINGFVEDILVVIGSFIHGISFALRSVQGFCQFPERKIIIAVFKGAGSVFIYFNIIWNVP